MFQLQITMMGMTILHVNGSNEVLYSTADTDLAQGTISNSDFTVISCLVKKVFLLYRFHLLL